ncbi:hypothetical protein PPYR_12081 [Photinus pyralis]|uniref:ZP domain-containing protein n=1 Tax=Photinus pyralis TaxID=7054 RepID=A0A1Y1MRW6_PHOPY|nr:uncharacterized protein LOC116176011 [Photinus pyralis]KAB0795242.1 hypothetical protein PPYR_12081 [Photinus pyralis]
MGAKSEINLFNFSSLFFLLFFIGHIQQSDAQLTSTDFLPQVTATCKTGHMSIRVAFNSSFSGAVHAREFRTPACMVQGDGSKLVTLDVNLFAPVDSPEYCGLLVNNKTEERSISIAVRVHRTLELAEDKLYVITCGKAGYRNANNETSQVSLRLLEGDKKIVQAVYSRPYTLRVTVSRPDGIHGFKVKSCFAFNKPNDNVALIDDRGCSDDPKVIEEFVYDEKTGIADAKLNSMFRFAEGSEVHLQCDIGLCRGPCQQPICTPGAVQSRALEAEEGPLMAATTVFVLDPSEAPIIQGLCDDGVHPSWLLWLCIALGILFLIMLIINIFLCSAMTCACARTEIVEKEPSIIEDYDPYRSWHGSQYGSRYSLNGAPQNPKGYTSGGSTMNSTRSVSSHSDHYAIVHSRPGSRYKNRGPPSHIGSHYSGK